MENQVFGRSWSVWMADTVLKKFPELRNRWAYDYGVVCLGLIRTYELTNDQKYLDYVQSNMDYFVNEDGTIRFYDRNLHNLDYVNNGKILLFLYEKTGDEKYKKAVSLLRSQLEEQPRTKEGGFWHKDVYPHQMWLDGLYMAEPFYAQYITMFGKEEEYRDVVRQFSLIEKHLRNPETGLYYHGWDESRESFWADKKTGRSENYWGRSVGWFACALVDTLDFIQGEERREKLVNMVQDLAIGIVKCQSEKNGLWYQVLDQEDTFGNYPEASCSCMFAYFLLKAVNKGYIDSTFFYNGKKAFYAIIREFIDIDQNTLLDLKGTVYVSGLGGNRLRDGSYEYYISEPKQTNNLLGIGAFVMASVELERIKIDHME